MIDNQFYVGLMEGRFPFHVESTTDPEDSSTFIATYTDQNGVNIVAHSTSQADAHNECTRLVREAVRAGHVTPAR